MTKTKLDSCWTMVDGKEVFDDEKFYRLLGEHRRAIANAVNSYTEKMDKHDVQGALKAIL